MLDFLQKSPNTLINKFLNKNTSLFLFLKCEFFIFKKYKHASSLKENLMQCFSFFLPDDFFSNFLTRKFHFILIKLESSSYTGFRHFLLMPAKSSRTRSNSKSQKLNNRAFIEYYKNFYYKKIKVQYPSYYAKHFLYAEILNNIWFRFFNKEWNFAKIRRIEYSISNKYVSWRYDLSSILANRIYVYLQKKEILKKNKKRKNKKKVKIKNNLFNVGFEKHFTLAMQRFILSYYSSAKHKSTKNKK